MMKGFQCGMGIGGWLTNYKRFNVLPNEWRMPLTIGDFEHFESYIIERDISYIAELGFDHIRLGFDQVVVEKPDGSYREDIWQLIETFINHCRKHDLSVVLNLHKAIGNYCDIQEDVSLLEDEGLQARFIALWVEMEKRFADYPEVAFELLNEVRNVPPDQWNDLAEKTLLAIRALSPNRLVIIGSTNWNSVDTLKDLRVYDDPHVAYTFHTYEPFCFTHQQGVLQARALYYNRKMPYPGEIERYREYERLVLGTDKLYAKYDRMDERFIRDNLAPAVAFQKAHPNAVLWCGEFGTIRHAKLEWRENYMRDVIAFLKANHIPYCVWNYLSTPNDGNRFSLVDDNRREILSERLHRILLGQV